MIKKLKAWIVTKWGDATIRENSIAFSMWLQQLPKQGYPKTEKGHMMSIYELYDYWDKEVNKTPFLLHAKQFKND